MRLENRRDPNAQYAPTHEYKSFWPGSAVVVQCRRFSIDGIKYGRRFLCDRAKEKYDFGPGLKNYIVFENVQGVKNAQNLQKVQISTKIKCTKCAKCTRCT